MGLFDSIGDFAGKIGGAVGDFGTLIDPTNPGYQPARTQVAAPPINFQEYIASLQNRQNIPGMQAAQLQMDNTGRSFQDDLAQRYMAQLNGQAPSLAAMQLDQARNANIQTAMAQAASQRGGVNAGLALRQTQNTTANVNQQAAQQGAMLRAQENQMAMQGLGGLAQNMQSNAYNQALADAQLRQQAALTNYQGTLQQRGMNDQAILGMVGQAQGYAGMQAGADSAYQDLLAKRGLATYEARQKLFDRVMSTGSDMFGKGSQMFGAGAPAAGAGAGGAGAGAAGAGGAGGAAALAPLAACDINLKNDITDASNQIQEFLNSINAQSWVYKDEKYGAGTRFGVMAQDVETTPVGKTMVVETNDGKMLDVVSGMTALLASVAHLNKRLNDLEQR